MMTHLPRTGGLQKKFFVALLIAGIVPGIVALVATYLYSTNSLKHSIGSSFQCQGMGGEAYPISTYDRISNTW